MDRIIAPDLSRADRLSPLKNAAYICTCGCGTLCTTTFDSIVDTMLLSLPKRFIRDGNWPKDRLLKLKDALPELKDRADANNQRSMLKLCTARTMFLRMERHGPS